MKLPEIGMKVPLVGKLLGGMSPEEIVEEAEKLRWYHCLRLTRDYYTPGLSGFSLETPGWETTYQFPSRKDLKGKSLLDIGTMNGIMAYEAERRGASRVLAIDRDPPGFPDAREAFDLAGRALRSKVVSYEGLSIYDLDKASHGTFDFVLLYGVLYHLKFPLLGLYRAAMVCKEELIVETHVTTNDDLEQPMMIFYPGSELNGDARNWWGPNPRAVDAMLEHLGFEIIGRASSPQEVQGFQPGRYTARGRRVAPTPDPWEM